MNPDPQHMSDEATVWKGRQSQLLNFWVFSACGLIIIAFIVGAFWMPLVAVGIILPLGFLVWKWLVVRCRIYELTSQRMRLYSGVLNQSIDEIELYRVKDTTINRPFLLRMFNLSNIHLATSDRSFPDVNMRAIHDGVTVREMIRKNVEIVRDEKRVREVDFDSSGGDDMEFDDMDAG
jgi:membrane protein YdbS with pleckstrin-like domain